MTTSRQTLGHVGESAAVRHLLGLGWMVLERNYRCRAGEIDVVARDQESVVFVEVRTRASEAFGTPEESITPSKARRMMTCALTYMATHPDLSADWRIDVIAVRVERDRTLSVSHYRNAVES
jgi:putative endonuclease